MIGGAAIFDVVSEHPLRSAFLRWQCRVRQTAMRDDLGRPNDGMTPEVTIDREDQPLRKIITVMSRRPAYSIVPEFRQLYKGTNDPALRRDKAIQFLSERYYQSSHQFSDALTATFSPQSESAGQIESADRCLLRFSQFSQTFVLECRTRKLDECDPHYQATWWHNALVNPNLNPDTTVLVFEPNWNNCSADPPIPS